MGGDGFAAVDEEMFAKVESRERGRRMAGEGKSRSRRSGQASQGQLVSDGAQGRGWPLGWVEIR